MNPHFTITYNDEHIQVEKEGSFSYNLKYPDFKYIMLDRNENGWVVEDRSGDYWTDEDITALGALIESNEPPAQEDEEENAA